jgi:hypothetical protein
MDGRLIRGVRKKLSLGISMKRAKLLAAFILLFFACVVWSDDFYRVINNIGGSDTEIVVRQTNAGVQFEFYFDRLSPSRGRVRTRCGSYTLSIDKDNRTIWDIAAPGFATQAALVSYGVLPKGFEQRVPEKGAAPALEFGNKYHVLASCSHGGETTFIYEGAPRKAK